MAVRNRNGWLYTDFYCILPNGSKTRCVESTGLKDTQGNRKLVEAKNKSITYELKHGRFDYLHFFPDGTKAKHFKKGSDLTLKEWWEQYLSEKTVRPSTFENLIDRRTIRISPALGHMCLGDISEPELLVFRKGLQDSGLKNNAINKIMDQVCGCLRKAAKRKLIAENPCAGIKRLAEERRDIYPFSVDELRHFLTFLEGMIRSGVTLSIFGFIPACALERSAP